MNSLRVVQAAWRLPVLAGMFTGLAFGQEPQEEVAEEGLVRRRGSLTWLKVGGEWRGRVEALRNGDFVGGHAHEYWLNRVRLGVEVEPRNLFRVRVEGIDARLAGNLCPGEQDSFTNATELYQAYVEAGGEGQRARLRVGRMEMAFGDERLIGSDRKLSPYGQVFAGAAGGVRWGPTYWDVFTLRLMAPDAWHLDRRDRRSKLQGVYGSIPWEGLVVEPYLIVKDVPWEAGPGGHQVYTVGARSAGPVAPRVSYNAEAAWQGGHRGTDHIGAKALHAELGWRTGARRRDPAVSVEYNYGSGDTNPGDGRHGSFDDLYPAGFNRFGMADAFAWINIHNAMMVGEWTLSRKWQVAGGYRSTWVAHRADALYFDSVSYLCVNPGARSSHVGQEVFVGGNWRLPGEFRLGFGYSHFRRGAYLKSVPGVRGMSTPFVSLETRF